MKKRTALGVVTAVALLPGCSSPSVSTQMGLHAQMESGPAINSTNGRYRAGTADIALTKIVSLPDDQLGFRFVISAPSLRGGCCSFFPRVALVGQTDVRRERRHDRPAPLRRQSRACARNVPIGPAGARRESLAPDARDTYPG